MKNKILLSTIVLFLGIVFFAHNVFAGTATVSWNANTESDLASYKIYYGTSPRTGTDPKICGMCGYSAKVDVGKVLTYTFNNLTDGFTYYFSISAIDTSNNESSFSAQVNKTIPASIDTTPPAVSITVPISGSTVSGSSVAVSANASDNVGVAGVQFKLDGTNIGAEDTTSPYSIVWNTTLTTNGSHALTALARDAAGNQTTSSGITVTVNNITSDTTAPTIPTNLFATSISSSQINLTWTASTDNVGVAGYNIFRGGTQIGTSVTNSYSNTGLTANTAYSYAVSAYDAAGNNSSQSSSVSATTQPSTSTKFLINDRVQTIATLNVRSTPSTSGTLLGTQASGVLGTIIGGPTYANGYWWWNVNFDTGVDGWSVEDYLVKYSSPTDTTAPTIPTNLFATSISSSQINLTWTASTDNVGVAGYRVERCSGSGCSSFSQVAAPSANSYNDTGLSASTVYTYRVRATDAANNLSGYSNTASATTPVPSPIITIGETNILSLDDSGNGDLLLAQSATLSQTATIQSLSFYVTAASGKLSLGIYDSSGPSGGPGQKKAETAEITPTVGWNTANITNTPPVSLSPGTYWLAYLPQSSNLAFKRSGTGTAKYYAFTYGALPQTFSTSPLSVADHWSFYATLNTVADTTPPAVSAVTSSSITSSGAAITWTTNEASDSQVEYGLTTGYGNSTVLNASLVTSHSQTLSGLSASTLYNYRVKSKDAAGNLAVSPNYTFTTQAPPDSAPPSRFNKIPSANLNYETTGAVIGLNTDENSTCKYSTVSGTPYSSMTGSFISIGGKSHYAVITGITSNTSYPYYARCQDAYGNVNPDDFNITVTVANDTTAPTRTNNFPRGNLSKRTTEVNLSLNTDENSTCKYSTVSGTPYSSMANTFTNTGGLTHSTPVTGLTRGRTYKYYVKCFDARGNANTNDFSIFFSVSSSVASLESNQILASSETPSQLTSSLSYGTQSEEVALLQEVLAKINEIYPEKMITGFFGNLTRKAVQNFQCSYGIVCEGDSDTTGHGRVGPRTRVKINEMMAGVGGGM